MATPGRLNELRRAGRRQFDAFAQGREAVRTDVINIASVRVAGAGGLGLVVIAMALAWSMPRIGQTIALEAVLGVGMAAVLILRRRRLDPIATSSSRPGANTTLSIDDPVSPEKAGTAESRNEQNGKVRLSAADAA